MTGPRLSFIGGRIRTTLAARGAASNTVMVKWTLVSGGTVDPGTGGVVGGTETHLSGAVRAFCHEVPARNEYVKFAEVQTGDLILDLAPDAQVGLYPGQVLSGALSLADVPPGARFIHAGRYYELREVSGELQAAWDAVAGDRRLHRTLLLKRRM